MIFEIHGNTGGCVVQFPSRQSIMMGFRLKRPGEEKGMCGRYYVDDDTAREIEKLVHQVDRKLHGTGNGDIHPSENALVLTGRKTSLSAEVMKWGFPQYRGKGLLINARSETVLDKRMFRDSVLHRRCIIPAKHFYEWDRSKEKVSFFRENSPVIYMAGFYNRFQEEDRFIILTVPANVSVEPVHDRMPLILEEQEIQDWVYEERFLDYALHKQQPQLQKYQPYIQQSLF